MAIIDVDASAALSAPASGATEPRPQAQAPRSGGYLPYFPALDGIRAVAVIAVLFFHGGFTWAVGGYLGVSTFFTLSGFLITSLLLAERNATDSIDLRAFWGRRFRRLMPASLVALALVVVFGLVQASPLQRKDLDGDVFGALGYVANWRFVFSGKGYNAIFAGGSPVQHFWSLAIEEQFYFVYPLLAWVLLRKLRASDKVFGLVLVALTAASVALPFVLHLGADRIYYGTDTRAAELLAGGVLAVVLNQRRVTERLARSRSAQRVVAGVGVAALAVCIWLWSVAANEADPSSLLYNGGFALYSLLSVALVLASLLPIGPVRILLANPVFRWIGQVSYGVYVYHWPVFLWVDSAWRDAGIWARFGLKIAVTFALAAVSAALVERPVRTGRRLVGLRPVVLAPVVVLALVGSVVAVSASAPEPENDFEAQQQQLRDELEERSLATPPPTTAIPDVPPRARIATFGDSTALKTSYGLNPYYIKSNTADLVNGFTELGCSIMINNKRRGPRGIGENAETCNRWPETWKTAVDKYRPNAAMIQLGMWEVPDQMLPNDTEWRALGDPRLDQVLLSQMVAVTDMFADSGVDALWVTMPPVGTNRAPDAPPGSGIDPVTDHGNGALPERARRFNELLDELHRLRPSRTHIIDLGSWLTESGDDARLRPDGVHFGQAEAEEVSQRYLGPALVEAFEEDWRANEAARKAKPVTRTAEGTAPKVLWVGDSVGLGLALGMGSYADDTGEFESYSIAEIGCGIGRGGKRLHPTGITQDACPDWSVDKFPAGLAKARPDLVIVANAVWDSTDRILPGETRWRALGDPVYDEYLAKELAAAADLLHSQGAVVAWLAYPHIQVGKIEPGVMANYPANIPARTDRLNELVRETASTRPWMQIIDLAAHAQTWSGGEFDEGYRPDGVHFVATSAERLIREWLGDELEKALAAGRAAN